MICVIRLNSSSLSLPALVICSIRASLRICSDVYRPIPGTYVNEIQIDLPSGMSTPTIRGIYLSFLQPSSPNRRRARSALPLTLLVSRVRADHAHDAFAADDLAVLTATFYRASYLDRKSGV